MLPIESISMAPKSQEVSHMHQNQIHKEQAAQENIQSGFAYQISHNSKQTVKTSKSDNGDYLDRQKNKNKKDKREGKEKDKTSEKSANNDNKSKKNYSFDMKI